MRPPCPVCSGQTFRPHFEQRPFTVVVCQTCGLFCLHPIPQTPSALQALYPSDYEPYQEPPVPSFWQSTLRRRHYAYRVTAVTQAHRSLSGNGRCLDIGCGPGGFLQNLQKTCPNWQVYGTDLHPQPLQTARQHALPVWCGLGDALPLPTASFNAVTLWEVLEHVPNPRHTLAEIHRVLKPDGNLLLSTPNGHSWQARYWGVHWAGWDTPRHLHVFTPPTLNRLLSETGFRLVRRLVFPMERFFMVESAQRARLANGRSRSSLLPALGVLAWPLLRALDFSRWSSSFVWQVEAI